MTTWFGRERWLQDLGVTLTWENCVSASFLRSSRWVAQSWWMVARSRDMSIGELSWISELSCTDWNTDLNNTGKPSTQLSLSTCQSTTIWIFLINSLMLPKKLPTKKTFIFSWYETYQNLDHNVSSMKTRLFFTTLAKLLCYQQLCKKIK